MDPSHEPRSPASSVVSRVVRRVHAALAARWFDNNAPVPYAYTPLSIPGDSVAVTKYKPATVSDKQVVAALAVICSVTFLALVFYVVRRAVKRRRRVREELESKASVFHQQMEKGSPPVELDAPSLWGKRLKSWTGRSGGGEPKLDAENGQLEAPRPPLVREESDTSIKSAGSSVKSVGSAGSSPSFNGAEFGIVTRLPRKPSFERKKSKLRLVRGDLDHVPEEEDVDGAPYASSPASPSSTSSTSSTTFPTSTFPSTRTSSLPSAASSPVPPAPTALPQADSLPTGLRPLTLTHSYSQSSIRTYDTTSPSGSTSPLHPIKDDDDDGHVVDAKVVRDDGCEPLDEVDLHGRRGSD